MKMKKQLTGDDLIGLGYEPGKHFGEMLKLANSIYESQDDIPEVLAALDAYIDSLPKPLPVVPLQDPLDVKVFIDIPDQEGFERDNALSALAHARELSRVPTIRDVLVMPDACPSGGVLGTIPVGCVAVAENAIHPGMHSADICCSMFLTELPMTFDGVTDYSDILDAVMKVTHFGVGGRKDLSMGQGHDIVERAKKNRYLASVQMFKAMSDHLGTQGDGNHFFYVGYSENTRKVTLVTHHGSRKPGALLYKLGMQDAEYFRRQLSPDTHPHNAWIPFDTDEGQQYWEALDIIREWTKYNHTVIHDLLVREMGLWPSDITDRFWNEHNFVFKQGDLFYHAKGSTPVYNHSWDADDQGRKIIPLNMAEPILIVKNHSENEHGFAPHGAGRNMSRTQFNKINAGKTPQQIMKEQVGHIDARFYSGKPDISELPGAYKNAEEVQAQIVKYQLAEIVDRIQPIGCVMAGEQEQFWRKK